MDAPDLSEAARDYEASLIDVAALSDDERRYLDNLQEVDDDLSDEIDCDLYEEAE